MSQKNKYDNKNFKKKSKKFRPPKKKCTKTSRENEEIARLKELYNKYDPKKIKMFKDMPLSEYTLKALEEQGFEEPTEIQRQSIGLSLRGNDVLGAAKTGSGKTLAFVIPMLERLYVSRWSKMDGLGALVITPTRELAYQIFETLRKVGKNHDFSAGLVIGGKDLKFESNRMSGCNIVICTPGRLLQHMDENPQFDAASVQMLILDEADRCLDLGFSETMNAILSNLPPPSETGRQTLLFSATQTRSVKDLARLSLKEPIYVSVHEHAEYSTPDQLTQSYSVCDLDQKIDLLWSFIKNHKRKKILVFLQSCKQVRYIQELFKRLRTGVPTLGLYGSLHQLRRMSIYEDFCQREGAAILLATDIAARGLDFPKVDWVVQLDCPEDAKTYLHRVGRTARHTSIGRSLLILMPSEEEAMVKQLKAHKIPIEKIEVNPNKLVTIQRKIEAHLAGDKNLKEMAQRAFQSYIKSVYLMKNKSIFDVFKLDLANFSKSLGLAVTPRVRFLQKQMKLKKAQQKGQQPEEEEEEVVEFNGSDDDDNDDDIEDGDNGMLVVKRKDHALNDDDEDDKEERDKDVVFGFGKKSAAKVTTKAALAKKVLKKKIKANTVVKFGEDGEAKLESTSQKASELGKKYEMMGDSEEGGINIPAAREVLKAEDKFDREFERRRVKERHKEERRKAKELLNKRLKANKSDHQNDSEQDEEEDDSQPNLDWLPDPDKYYDNESKSGGSSDSDSSSKSEGDDESGKRKWKPKKKENLSSKKRKVVVEEGGEALDREELIQDEDIALKLLRGAI